MQKKRDLLCEVYQKKITDHEARLVFEAAQHEFHHGALEIAPGLYLTLSFAELTLLLLYGLPYSFVAKWRYEGWPKTCAMCGKPIDIDADGWNFNRSLKIDDCEIKDTLTCMDCGRILIKESEKIAKQQSQQQSKQHSKQKSKTKRDK